MDHSTFVGLDVHKKSTSVALAEAGRDGEVRFHGEIATTPDATAGREAATAGSTA